MQLTSPFFVFIFLPLALLLFILLPHRYRTATLLAVSLLWLLLLNDGNLFALALFLLVFLLAYLPGLLPQRERLRPLAVMTGIVLPVTILLTVHYLCFERALFVYPHGITFAVMGAVSLTADRLTGRLAHRAGLPATASALFPFPFMTVGPFFGARYLLDLHRDLCPTIAGVSYGARLFLQGYIKVLMFSAPFAAFFQHLISLAVNGVDVYLAFLIPAVALFAVGFFLSGSFDMGCGISACFGMRITAGDGGKPSLPRLFLDWLYTYVYEPLSRLPVVGRVLAPLATALVPLPLLRHAPALWQLLLPTVLLVALLLFLYDGKPPRLPALAFLLLPLLGLPAAALLVEEPEMLLPWSPLFPGLRNEVFYLSTSFIEEVYRALLSLALLLPPLLLSLIKRLLRRSGRPRITTLMQVLELLLTLLYFALTVLYFLPKFPALATGLPTSIYW